MKSMGLSIFILLAGCQKVPWYIRDIDQKALGCYAIGGDLYEQDRRSWTDKSNHCYKHKVAEKTLCSRLSGCFDTEDHLVELEGQGLWRP